MQVIESARGHMAFDQSETSGERLHAVVEADEHETMPGLHTIPGEAVD